MERAGWDYPTGDIRVSDADRDRAIAELSEARLAGRITADEFDERSGQAVAARTGAELTALLDDLPPGRAPVTRGNAPQQTGLVFPGRAIAAVTAAAMCAFAAIITTANVASPGPTAGQQDIMRKIAASQGQQVPVHFPATPVVDWVSVIKPAMIAALLVALVIFLCVRSSRAGRS